MSIKALVSVFLPCILMGCNSESDPLTPDLLEPIGTDRVIFVESTVQDGAIISVNENVYVSIQYEVASTDEALIFIRPESCITEGGCTYVAHSSPVFETGTGNFIGDFTFTDPSEITHLSITMEDRNSRNELTAFHMEYHVIWQ